MKAYQSRAMLAATMVLSFVTFASPARAGAVAVDVTGGTIYQRGSFENFGWSFDLAAPTTVTALGFFDFHADGLADPHQTGIWDSSGTLLTSVTITNADPLSPSTSGLGGWRFQGIAALDLAAGTYTIGSYFPTAADFFIGTATGLTTLPGITFGNSLATPGVITTFAEPMGVVGGVFPPGFFGPNFEIPEPPVLPALLGAGLLLAFARTRGMVARRS